MNKKIKLVVSSILIGISGITLFKFYNKDKTDNITNIKEEQVEQVLVDVKNEDADTMIIENKVEEEIEIEEKVATNEEIKTDDEEIIEKPVAVTKKLSVDANKCIGCKRCVKIAGDNFVMNSSKKAVVISQNNLESNSVEKAIEKCPVGAISL
ncbi:MAG: ferredoxin [Candidatus Moranbacteria bacterium]|nr:ferredoxin [Candidatus Moranbacteria bacterium]